ncbi:MAG TPA: AAA family ATPase, partial [Allosphingosinicella sp.]
MHVSRLSLTDFRSYPDALVEPGPGLVILTGENGAGKTNMLEALSLLAPGRGLRGAALSEMARQGGGGGFAVAARLALPLDKGGLGGGGVSVRSEPDVQRHPTPNPPPSRGGEQADIGTGVIP